VPVTERTIVAPGRLAPSGRLAWVDAARGACVAAVVLFHVCLWWYLPMVAPSGHPVERVWATLNSYLGSVRMPLLLAVSGLVSSRRIRSGLRDAGTITRVVANGYLYVVWVGVYALFYALVAGDVPHRVDGVGQTLWQLVVPETTLWYLYALALYTLGLAAVRRAPAAVVLTVLAVVSVASRVLLGDGPGMWPRLLELAVFFAVGVYGAPWLRSFAAGVTLPRAVLCAGLALVTTLAGRLPGGEVVAGLVFLARGTAFLLTTVAVVVIAARWRPVERMAAGLGRRTLSVYVLHVLLLAVLIVTTRALTGGPVLDAAGAPAVAAVLPLVVAVVVILACIGAERLLRACGLAALFRMPEPMSRAVSRRSRTQPAVASFARD
jgi:uncharacterized membrane protein YcfT